MAVSHFVLTASTTHTHDSGPVAVARCCRHFDKPDKPANSEKWKVIINFCTKIMTFFTYGGVGVLLIAYHGIGIAK